MRASTNKRSIRMTLDAPDNIPFCFFILFIFFDFLPPSLPTSRNSPQKWVLVFFVLPLDWVLFCGSFCFNIFYCLYIFLPISAAISPFISKSTSEITVFRPPPAHNTRTHPTTTCQMCIHHTQPPYICIYFFAHGFYFFCYGEQRRSKFLRKSSPFCNFFPVQFGLLLHPHHPSFFSTGNTHAHTHTHKRIFFF